MKLDPSAFVAAPELIEALEPRCIPISCDEDRVLFHQGDAPTGLYILRRGETTLSMTSLTGELLMEILAPVGSLLGLPGLIGNEEYTLTATARKGAELCFVSRDEFTSLMQGNPQLSLKILRVLAAEVRSARRALVEL